MHSRCAEELVACGLPFHGTTQFVRLVQATKVEGTAWEWLKPMQASGAPLPRATLAQRCVKDKVRMHLSDVKETPLPNSGRCSCNMLKNMPALSQTVLMRDVRWSSQPSMDSS